MNTDQRKDLYATIAVVVVVLLAVVGVLVKNRSASKETALTSSEVTTSGASLNESTAESDTAPKTETVPAETRAVQTETAKSTYKDGTYTATQKYSTPEDTESIKVTVTVANDVITDVSATPSAKSRESKEYANAFVANYKTYVVGKSLKGLKLNRVSGASLTTQGFNNAITNIQSQAQV